MKKHYIIFILISCAFILTACNASPVSENKNLPESSTDFESIEVGTKCEDMSISAYTPQSNELNPQTEAEKQLVIFAEYYMDWQVKEEQDWWGYTVTDLDQDGNLEIISSECHGTGHYTSTSIYEIDPIHPHFSVVCNSTSSEASATLEALSHGGLLMETPLLMPHQAMSGVPQTYPVYYDENKDVYYYIYEDSINNPDDWSGVFTTQRSFSLRCGEIPGISYGGEATGILLGCKKNVYHDNHISVDYWDMYGNYISEDTYGKLAEQYYEALQKKEASILWIECQNLEDLNKEEIYNLLKLSMDSFSLSDI